MRLCVFSFSFTGRPEHCGFFSPSTAEPEKAPREKQAPDGQVENDLGEGGHGFLLDVE